MFKLTKDELKRRDELRAALEASQSRLETAIEAYNAAMEAAQEPLREAVDAFNADLEQTRQFVGDIVGQAESDYSEKSEKWQEGERGQAAQEWENAWREAEGCLEDIELELPEPLTIDPPAWGDALDTAESAGEL